MSRRPDLIVGIEGALLNVPVPCLPEVELGLDLEGATQVNLLVVHLNHAAMLDVDGLVVGDSPEGLDLPVKEDIALGRLLEP